MPSTNKLSSHRLRSNSQHHVSGSLAKFLLSFCGIASFGVSTILVALAATFSVSILSNNSVSALSTVSNQVSVNIPGSIALRLLDSTATAEIDSLSFDLTPVASGASATKRTIVDVATSNPTGYKLYMQSNYQKDGNYTTNLVHQDASVTDSIPTSTSATSLYWNYHNPLTSTTNPIPAHGTPDKIGQYFSPTNSNQTPLDVNVSVDTSIVAGTYENQLLFSAVGNPTTVDYKVTFDPNGGTQAITTIEETAKAGVHGITIPSTSDYLPTKTGHTFDHWEIQGSTTANCNDSTTCNPGDLLKIYSDEEFTGDVTLKAIYTVNNYTVTVSNSATSSGASSLSIPYGGSKTVTVTPSTGYYLSSVTCPAGYTCSGYGTGTSYTGTQTVTVKNNNTASGGTLSFAGAKRSFTVSITNSATSSGASSLSIPYGGSKTVTVTPSSGYYLSSVTCPTGYTCSGYSTGYTKTGTQTVTVKNNNYLGGGTLKFTGTRLTLSQTCANAGRGSVFTYSGTWYRKMANGACWTRYSVASNTWWGFFGTYWNDRKNFPCPAGTDWPSLTEFNSLINTYGSGSALYNSTEWRGTFWTPEASADWQTATYLYVASDAAFLTTFPGNNAGSTAGMLCIVR